MGLNKQRIDTRNHFALKYSAFDPKRKNVIIVHGFNGTEHKTPMTILRNGKCQSCKTHNQRYIKI